MLVAHIQALQSDPSLRAATAATAGADAMDESSEMSSSYEEDSDVTHVSEDLHDVSLHQLVSSLPSVSCTGDGVCA